MSQTSNKYKFLRILEMISTLYRMNKIDSDTKNTLITLAKKSEHENFDGLYEYLSTQDEEYTEGFREFILFL